MSTLENYGAPEEHTTVPVNTLEVIIRQPSGTEKKILGTPEAVLRELLSYISTVYPSIELVSRVVLTVDAKEFLEACSGSLAASPEGLVILKDVSHLRDRELLMLQLAGARLMQLLGKRESDTVSLEELTRTMGRPTGTVAGRLSELWKEQLIERVGKGSYRLTTMGARIVV
ncbi:MAG TPA: hypothetical protein VE177_01975, partial [Candidatus Binatus sp.]|nr:hypothetical protein [Candidatus Binatus sp.]